MQKKTKILIVISVLLVAVVAGALVFLSNGKKIKETETLNQQLKDDLGKGSNGDIVSIQKEEDEEGNRTYTFTYNDGESETVTIRKMTEEEMNSVVNDETEGEVNDENIPSPDTKEDDKDSDDDDSEEEYGTVYERYNALSVSAKTAFYDSFKNPDDFFVWYEAAKREYEALHPVIEVKENEIIDFGNK